MSLREGLARLSSVPAQDRPCLQRKGSSCHPPPPTVVSCPPPGGLAPFAGLALCSGEPLLVCPVLALAPPRATHSRSGPLHCPCREGLPSPSLFQPADPAAWPLGSGEGNFSPHPQERPSLPLPPQPSGAGSVGQATWGQAWGAAVRLGPSLVLLLFRAPLWAPRGCGPLLPGLWAPTGKGAGVWGGSAGRNVSDCPGLGAGLIAGGNQIPFALLLQLISGWLKA